ncbi:hypothetical protein WOLCODRAFT_109999 [Wolfiporia cocos MD-104 SS10]|uniref:Flavin reductase like domain-containing protein n=1 Tax=Wolfiporia cocos (strain MD-104) TaxID=742152 RepID=A0A2H3JIF0_WOLCO|nr:hypothetical protein WOLCODRAFT_109999 [Wolfiporia cocos MD-104 SS10]
MNPANVETPPFDNKYLFRHTSQPNPQWTYGQPIDATAEGRKWMKGEEAGWEVIYPAEEERINMYALMISGIIPRPIAFVSTISENGAENIAPFSWFNMVTHNPPLVSISCSVGPVGILREKDTAHNIKTTGGFTVNMISEPWIEAANVCGIDAPEGISEWPISGLTKVDSLHVKPARVKESAFSMECELFQAVEISRPDTGEHTTTLVLGLVKCIHVRNDVLAPGPKRTVDPALLRTVARMGDITYSRIGEGFRLKRPVWVEEEAAIKDAVGDL